MDQGAVRRRLPCACLLVVLQIAACGGRITKPGDNLAGSGGASGQPQLAGPGGRPLLAAGGTSGAPTATGGAFVLGSGGALDAGYVGCPAPQDVRVEFPDGRSSAAGIPPDNGPPEAGVAEAGRPEAGAATMTDYPCSVHLPTVPPSFRF